MEQMISKNRKIVSKFDIARFFALCAIISLATIPTIFFGILTGKSINVLVGTINWIVIALLLIRDKEIGIEAIIEESREKIYEKKRVTKTEWVEVEEAKE